MHMNWTTKEKDLEVAENIIEEYSKGHGRETLGIFEIVVSQDKEIPDVRLADWVVTIRDYFQEKYGVEQGQFVTQMIISRCIVHGNTVH